jgi:Family of unknown function (DUF6302)
MKSHVDARTIEYYAQRLAEPWLLDKAVLLDVEANETPFAVPVGKLRRGGHIEFLDRIEAKKAFSLLKTCDGFPNLRIISCTLWWGDPAPFRGCDYTEPICAVVLGLYYGYKPEAIAEHFEQHMNFPRRIYKRKQILKLISSAASAATDSWSRRHASSGLGDRRRRR